MIKKKKSKKKIVIICLIVILIAIIFFKPKQEVIDTKIELEEIEKRDIATSISAIGKITTESTRKYSG